MISKEEWDRAFLRALPVASIGMGVFSAAMAILTLQRYGPLGQRVHYEDGRYLVLVRYPNVVNDIRDFVQPDNPDVLAIFSHIGPNYWSLYDWVCKNISYRRDVGEWWSWPWETIKRGTGDCEDSAILTCSLLRNFANAHVALGSFQGYGHAWCQLDGQILETTYTSARPVPDPQDYCPYVCFNDQEVVELWPGALSEVFELGRNEELKLALMAEAIGEKVRLG